MAYQNGIWFGTGVAAVSAAFYGLNVACVPLIYHAGGNVHVVNFVRPLFFIFFALGLILIRRKPVKLPPRALLLAYMVGVLFLAEYYGVHTAIKYIPVGLSILIVYTYPIIVSIVAMFLGKEHLTVRRVFLMAIAFGGLAIALGAGVESPDLRGVAWSALAAIGLVFIVIISKENMENHDFGTVMFHTMFMTSVIMAVFIIGGAELEWPTTSQGLTALIVATVTYAVATTLLFLAIHLIGPVRFAVIDNTAPLWAMAFAFLFLGETLTLTQMFGVSLVLAAVITFQATSSRRDL